MPGAVGCNSWGNGSITQLGFRGRAPGALCGVPLSLGMCVHLEVLTVISQFGHLSCCTPRSTSPLTLSLPQASVTSAVVRGIERKARCRDKPQFWLIRLSHPIPGSATCWRLGFGPPHPTRQPRPQRCASKGRPAAFAPSSRTADVNHQRPCHAKHKNL